MGLPLSERTRVYLIARPCLNTDGVEQFLKDESTSWQRTPTATESEQIVELGGRLCYMSFGTAQSPRTTSAYIDNLIGMGHESVLEHATWSFILTGISRAFTHQLVRHRIGFSFSQLSQQYHDERSANFVLPKTLQETPGALEIWNAAILHTKEAYDQLLTMLESHPPDPDQGLNTKEIRRAFRSAARSVLPNATETKIFLSANARAMRHFLKLRGSIVGDPEMRVVSSLLLRVMQAEAPAIFSDFQINNLTDGTPSVFYTGEK